MNISKAHLVLVRQMTPEAWERVQHGANAGNDLWIMLNRGLPGEVKTEDGLKVMSVLKQVCVQHISSGKDDDSKERAMNMNLQLLMKSLLSSG